MSSGIKTDAEWGHKMHGTSITLEAASPLCPPSLVSEGGRWGLGDPLQSLGSRSSSHHMGPSWQVCRVVIMPLVGQSLERKAQGSSKGRQGLNISSSFFPFYSKHFYLSSVRPRRDLNGKIRKVDL